MPTSVPRRLPPDSATPIIMVGPGTGLAPFRAFMKDRVLASRATCQPFGTSLLFFGCRRRDQDFLYRPLLEGWAAEGLLTLRTAFSREQVGGGERAVCGRWRGAEEGREGRRSSGGSLGRGLLTPCAAFF